MIRDYQAIGCTWFLRGHQRKIPTYGQHKGVKLIGTLDYETGRIICTEEGAYDAAAFLRFLERTLREYPTGKIVMVLDNARIHHAKLIQPFLKENAGRLALIFLPPYSPHVLSKFSSARRSILYFFVDLTGLTTKTTCHPPIFG